jgi:hypothetical protein
MKNAYRILVEYSEGKEHLGELSAVVRIILKWISNK